MDKLESCPFCGENRVFVTGSMVAYVRCAGCGCLGPNVTPKGDDPSDADREKAVELWNNRA